MFDRKRPEQLLDFEVFYKSQLGTFALVADAYDERQNEIDENELKVLVS